MGDSRPKRSADSPVRSEAAGTGRGAETAAGPKRPRGRNGRGAETASCDGLGSPSYDVDAKAVTDYA